MHPISKKKLAGKKPKITKAQSNAALIRALESVNRGSLKMCVYEAVMESLQDYDAEVNAVARALDPKSSDDTDNLTAARLEFTAKLDPGLISEFERLEDHTAHVAFWRELGSFYLGCAVAAQLTGIDVKR